MISRLVSNAAVASDIALRSFPAKSGDAISAHIEKCARLSATLSAGKPTHSMSASLKPPCPAYAASFELVSMISSSASQAGSMSPCVRHCCATVGCQSLNGAATTPNTIGRRVWSTAARILPKLVASSPSVPEQLAYFR